MLRWTGIDRFGKGRFAGGIVIEDIPVLLRRMPGQEDIPLPRYMTDSAAGMDICAAVDDQEIIAPGQRRVVPTGIAVALPEGYEAEIRPRSGLAARHGVTLVNAPGTIDADYRGEIRIILINHGQEPFLVKRGDRIAQMVVHRVARVTWVESGGLDQTVRGEGGFGHTR
jgi:dUTP pyrophosphatase